MIKRIIGLLFVAAAIAVIVLTVLDRNAYTSLVRTNGATQAGAAAMDGSADGNTADVGNMNSTGGMDSRRPAVSAGADSTAGEAGSSRPAVSAGADGDRGGADGMVGTHSTGRADGSAPESGVVPHRPHRIPPSCRRARRSKRTPGQRAGRLPGQTTANAEAQSVSPLLQNAQHPDATNERPPSHRAKAAVNRSERQTA